MAGFLILESQLAYAPARQITLLNGVTSVSTGTVRDLAGSEQSERSFIAHVTGTGSVSATVVIEVSNNNSHFLPLATVTLSGTGSDTDGFLTDDTWQFVRGRVSAISGTSAAVTLTAGV